MVKGIVRKIDELGRVVIPKEFRRSLKIKDGDKVDIYLKDGVISLERFGLKCVCCGNDDEDKLVQVNGVHMCPNCIKEYYKGVK